MREVLIGLIFLGIAIAIIVGVLWVSFSYLPEREHHNARPTPPAAIWSSGSAKRSTSRASNSGAPWAQASFVAPSAAARPQAQQQALDKLRSLLSAAWQKIIGTAPSTEDVNTILRFVTVIQTAGALSFFSAEPATRQSSQKGAGYPLDRWRSSPQATAIESPGQTSPPAPARALCLGLLRTPLLRPSKQEMSDGLGLAGRDVARYRHSAI
jgi:hypothetical protein